MRKRQTSLWVAASGVGKSQLLNNIAQRIDVPAVYWSADTEVHDVLVRSYAMWSGFTTTEVEEYLREGVAPEFFAEKIRGGRNVEWIFDPAITERHLHERLFAFAEVHGQFPELVVVDNLSNTVEHMGDEFAEQKAVMVAMQKLAMETGAHIAILAHAKGEYESGMRPIPKAGILNNLSKWVGLAVTLFSFNEEGTVLGLCSVKNRGGASDPAAKHPIRLNVDFSRAVVLGYEHAA